MFNPVRYIWQALALGGETLGGAEPCGRSRVGVGVRDRRFMVSLPGGGGPKFDRLPTGRTLFLMRTCELQPQAAPKEGGSPNLGGDDVLSLWTGQSVLQKPPGVEKKGESLFGLMQRT